MVSKNSCGCLEQRFGKVGWRSQKGAGENLVLVDVFSILIVAMVSQVRACRKTYPIARFKCVHFIVCQ